MDIDNAAKTIVKELQQANSEPLDDAARTYGQGRPMIASADAKKAERIVLRVLRDFTTPDTYPVSTEP